MDIINNLELNFEKLVLLIDKSKSGYMFNKRKLEYEILLLELQNDINKIKNSTSRPKRPAN